MDRGADDRMDEVERVGGAEDVGSRELERCTRRGGGVALGELGGQARVGAVAEDRRDAGELPGVRREPGEPQQDRARDGSRTQLAQPSCIRVDRRDAIRLEPVRELVQEKRVPAYGCVAGSAALLLGSLAEPLSEDAGGRRLAERSRGA